MPLTQEERDRIVEEVTLKHETQRKLQRGTKWQRAGRFLNSGSAQWLLGSVLVSGLVIAYHKWDDARTKEREEALVIERRAAESERHSQETAEAKRHEDIALAGLLNTELRYRLTHLAANLRAEKRYLDSSPEPDTLQHEDQGKRIERFYDEARRPKTSVYPQFQDVGLEALLTQYEGLRPGDNSLAEAKKAVAWFRQMSTNVTTNSTLGCIRQNLDSAALYLGRGGVLCGWTDNEMWTTRDKPLPSKPAMPPAETTAATQPETIKVPQSTSTATHVIDIVVKIPLRPGMVANSLMVRPVVTISQPPQ